MVVLQKREFRRLDPLKSAADREHEAFLAQYAALRDMVQQRKAAEQQSAADGEGEVEIRTGLVVDPRKFGAHGTSRHLSTTTGTSLPVRPALAGSEGGGGGAGRSGGGGAGRASEPSNQIWALAGFLATSEENETLGKWRPQTARERGASLLPLSSKASSASPPHEPSAPPLSARPATSHESSSGAGSRLRRLSTSAPSTPRPTNVPSPRALGIGMAAPAGSGTHSPQARGTVFDLKQYLLMSAREAQRTSQHDALDALHATLHVATEQRPPRPPASIAALAPSWWVRNDKEQKAIEEFDARHRGEEA